MWSLRVHSSARQHRQTPSPCRHRIAGDINSFYFPYFSFFAQKQWTTGLHCRRLRVQGRQRPQLLGQERLRHLPRQQQQTRTQACLPARQKTNTASHARASRAANARPAATSTHTAHRAIHHARGASKSGWSARWRRRVAVGGGQGGRMSVRRMRFTIRASLNLASHHPVPSPARPHRHAAPQSA